MKINSRLSQIIKKCELLRKRHGFDYEEKCGEVIDRFSKEIIDNELILNSQDKEFAIQLCMMNSLKFRV